MKGWDFIVPRQRARTATFPRPDNRRHIVPKRLFRLATGPGFDGVYVVTLGDLSGGLATGYFSGQTDNSPVPIGSCVPNETVNGTPINEFFANPGSGDSVLTFIWGVEQGVTGFNITVDAEPTQLFTWGGFDYVNSDAALNAYIVSKLGLSINVTAVVVP